MQGAAETQEGSALVFSEAGDGVGGPQGEAPFKVQAERDPYLAGCTNRGGDGGEPEGKLPQWAGQDPEGWEMRSR